MQAAFRAALAGDLAALKAAIQQYKEQVARLQCQKQLLLSQARPHRNAVPRSQTPRVADTGKYFAQTAAPAKGHSSRGQTGLPSCGRCMCSWHLSNCSQKGGVVDASAHVLLAAVVGMS